ncbi:MFS transporter [Cellulomonas sp. WB94]|uniref:L-lactate MFS transporter n=1 Tax=Cellulomonas sp. WB94 TaxID=2173174 RepID=UPI000D57CA74|nr:OFA family MFS transporter [Cellulomonas sp. WB94]PVU82206.1 MFS transporter [Cellulomonas sp. WB94]
MSSTSAPAPRNRWIVFAGAWVITFFIAAVAVFSVLVGPLGKANGWTSSQTALAFSLYTLCLAVCGIFSGRFADTYGAQKLMYLGGALFGLGWFLTGYATTPAMMYLTFGVIAGSGCGIVYNPALATTLKWFPDIRGKASGMLLAAAAIGPALLAPATVRLLDATDVGTTLRTLGIVFFVAIAACGWLVTAPPAGYRPAGWTPTPAQAVTSAGHQLTWRQMVATPRFGGLIAAFACAAAAGTMMVTSISGIAQFQIGAVGGMTAAAFGALVVSISTVANFCGRLSFGAIFDRLGGYPSLLISLGVTIAAMLTLTVAHGVALFVVCVVALGFAFGGILVIFPPLTGHSFGIAHLGINYGLMFLGYAIGGFVGPRLTGSFFDETIGYRNAYIGAVVIGLLGVAITVVLMRAARRESLAVTPVAAPVELPDADAVAVTH